MTFRMHSFFSLAINSDLCVMDGVTIKRYSFNVPSTIGIEAKSLDFLWEKAPLTEGIHRTDFYHLIWVERGELFLTVDFEELYLQNNDAFLISPGQICHFNLLPIHKPSLYYSSLNSLEKPQLMFNFFIEY